VYAHDDRRAPTYVKPGTSMRVSLSVRRSHCFEGGHCRSYPCGFARADCLRSRDHEGLEEGCRCSRLSRFPRRSGGRCGSCEARIHGSGKTSRKPIDPATILCRWPWSP
jgi:hypothetical protein